MLVDTDVLIWVLRGNRKAAKAIEAVSPLRISTVTYMELLQGARDKREVRLIKSFLGQAGCQTLPLTENISHRAVIYLETYGLSHALQLADSLIAATATETGEELLTANDRHYRVIADLSVKRFRP